MDMKFKNLPMEEIKTRITNCRDNADDGELVESIRSTGLQSPIGVVCHEGEYTLVYGHRRYHACRALGHTHISARILPNGDQADLMVLNLQENVARKDLSPIEEARAIHRIMEAGKDIEEFRAALGWSKTIITQRLSLLELSEQVQHAVSEGKVSVRQAHAIDAAPVEHRERLISLADKGATTRAIKEEVDQLNEMGRSFYVEEPSIVVEDAVIVDELEEPETIEEQIAVIEERTEADHAVLGIQGALINLVSVLVSSDETARSLIEQINKLKLEGVSSSDTQILYAATTALEDSHAQAWAGYEERFGKHESR